MKTSGADVYREFLATLKVYLYYTLIHTYISGLYYNTEDEKRAKGISLYNNEASV